MATTLVSIEEYLNTSFPGSDCEYVDGRIVERNLGEKPHSYAQGEVYFFFRSLGRKDVFAYPEQRVQVKPTRFRVPDVCVYVGADPKGNIFTDPPFLAVEILSEDDRASELEEKVDDYLSFGVQHTCVVDPSSRKAYVYTGGNRYDATSSLWTANPEFKLTTAQLF